MRLTLGLLSVKIEIVSKEFVAMLVVVVRLMVLSVVVLLIAKRVVLVKLRALQFTNSEEPKLSQATLMKQVRKKELTPFTVFQLLLLQYFNKGMMSQLVQKKIFIGIEFLKIS